MARSAVRSVLYLGPSMRRGMLPALLKSGQRQRGMKTRTRELALAALERCPPFQSTTSWSLPMAFVRATTVSGSCLNPKPKTLNLEP